MENFTFVHAADLHLDAPFKGFTRRALSSPFVPEKLISVLEQATFTALERLTELCLQSGAAFLVLSGDIYNSADNSLKARLALHKAFSALEKEQIQVYIAHGNHDPLSEQLRMQHKQAVPWPANVTVFQDEVSAHTVMRNGLPLARVLGISHAGLHEENNLAVKFPRKKNDDPVFAVGVLHCALQGNSGSHAAYAPCSTADLAAAGYDYWALGHVHACRVGPQSGPEFRRPFWAYSGSAQGLHVHETGLHGCLLVRVDQGAADPFAVPLAPVVWEECRLDLGAGGTEIEHVPALEQAVLDSLERITPDWPECRPDQAARPGRPAGEKDSAGVLYPCAGQGGYEPDYILVQAVLSGRTPLNHALRQPGSLEALEESIRSALTGTRLWLRGISLETRSTADPVFLAKQQGLQGEIFRLCEALRRDPEALQTAASAAFVPLQKNAAARAFHDLPDDASLQALLDEAYDLCLDLLEPDHDY